MCFNSTSNDNLNIKKLLTQCNFSDRHLRRLSNHYMGMKLEEYILYRMYIKSLLAIHDFSKSLTFIAHDNGFYDQSHFIRCFKTFTGLTPGEYRKQMSELPGHIYKDQSSMSV
ncbi:MAG: helix-turn-helix transcriptional regulator [Draconibacterium sp.]|nr:helix-turn-helix transcriptional regulator [Draconibacterium sp.]